jgi:pyruvate dehydrogenase E2 component (dihydrolipoamide acetyltransferase)
MPFTVNMPKLSPTMEEGTIAKWHKKSGDKVEAGELLVEIATDKATIEYNALDEGFLRTILIQEGDSAHINQPIAIFTETAEESIEGYEPKGVTVQAEEKTEELSEKTEPVEKPIRKASVTREQPTFEPMPLPPAEPFPFPRGTPQGRVPASPLARKLAKERGLDLTSIKGSGPSGRVVSRDLDLAQSEQVVNFGRREVPDVPAGSYEEVPLTPMRKVIGQRLQDAKSFIPHIYVRQEIDAAALVDLHKQLEECQLKVSFNALIVRATALALREHPRLNSGYDSIRQAMILFKTIDICVAVALEHGLITPIVRYADYKNVGEISVEIKELAQRARAGKLELHEYQGGSFTTSNLGMMGVSDFAAIINPPQAAILAISGIEECVRIRDGVPREGKRMNVTLSVDHRVVDGMDAAKFLKTLQHYLEHPAILLI